MLNLPKDTIRELSPAPTLPGDPTDQVGRLGRPRRRPVKLRDFVTHGVVGRLFPSQAPTSTPGHDQGASSSVATLSSWETVPDPYGFSREYIVKPSYIPDLSPDSTLPSLPTPIPESSLTLTQALGPFPNYSTYLHYKFFWLSDSNLLSDKANAKMVKELYRNPLFVTGDVISSGIGRLKEKIISYKPEPVLRETDGWKTSKVTIRVPLGRKKKGEARDFGRTFQFDVDGLRHRSLLGVIKNTIATDPLALSFHLFPFLKLYRPPHSSPETPSSKVYDEIYSSPAMLNEYKSLLSSPNEPGCTLEKAIVALQFWSDATHLTNFGSAKLWPLYGCFGNQSNFEKAKPSSHACHDIAYIPSVCNSLPLSL